MSAYIEAIVEMASGHAALVYALTFFLAFVESVPVVGVVIPGATIIIVLAALIPSGAIGLWPMIAAATAGAAAGDSLAYWIGWRFRDHLTQRWPFTRYPGTVDAAARFIARHGRKSVFLGRFTPPMRGFVPLMAGALAMPFRPFAVSTALAAVLWCAAHVTPGALVGALLTVAGAITGRAVVLLGCLGLVLWLIAWLARVLMRRGLPLIAAAQLRLLAWARQDGGWLARQVQALLDPAQGEARVIAALGLLLAFSAWVFLAVIENLSAEKPLLGTDVAIFNFLQGLRTSFTDHIMVALTELGDRFVTGGVAVAVLLLLLWRRAWHSAGYWIGVVGGASAITFAIKVALESPRPTALGDGWDVFSFPSGHATVPMAVYGFLAFLIGRELRGRWRFAVVAGTALFIGLIAFSRLYLGAHWLSDVVGGLAFSTAWVALLAIAYIRHRPPRLPVASLAAIPVAALLISGTIQIAREMPSDLARFAVDRSGGPLAFIDWWNEDWTRLPAWRIDLAGAPEVPLSLQWAGDPKQLRRYLAAAGWTEPPPWTVDSAIAWLSPGDPLHRPVLPKLHEGQPPALLLVRPAPVDDGAGRWVLRLWPTNNAIVARGGTVVLRVHVGAITLERAGGPLAPFAIGYETAPVSPPWDALRTALPETRLVRRPEAGAKADDQVLLARAVH